MPPDLIDIYTRAYTGREALRAGFEHYRTLLDDGKVNRAWVDGEIRLPMPMPVLGMGGERSTGSHVADPLRRAAPQVQGLCVDGAGHFVVEQQPQRFLQALDRFLGTGTHPHQQRSGQHLK